METSMPNNVKKVADVITHYSEKLHLFEKTGALDVYRSWALLVDEEMAAYTRLIDIERNTAIIETDHTGWAQQLMLKKRKIVQNFKKYYPQLEIETIDVVVVSQYKEIPIQKKAEKQYEEPIIRETAPEVKKELPTELHIALEKLKTSILDNEHPKKPAIPPV